MRGDVNAPQPLDRPHYRSTIPFHDRYTLPEPLDLAHALEQAARRLGAPIALARARLDREVEAEVVGEPPLAQRRQQPDRRARRAVAPLRARLVPTIAEGVAFVRR